MAVALRGPYTHITYAPSPVNLWAQYKIFTATYLEQNIYIDESKTAPGPLWCRQECQGGQNFKEKAAERAREAG